MKKTIAAVVFFLAALSMAHAQDVVKSSQVYTWAQAVTGNSGQMGRYIIIDGLSAPRPTGYTVDVSVSGTAPATCTFRVEGSTDASTWYGLDTTSPATTSCTANFMESIANRPVLYLRINLTYTQGDTTTKVIFHWTGGRS